jgi:hypothetical protein
MSSHKILKAKSEQVDLNRSLNASESLNVLYEKDESECFPLFNTTIYFSIILPVFKSRWKYKIDNDLRYGKYKYLC